MKKSEKKKLAKEIYDWCKNHDAWEDCYIIFDGKAWATYDEWGGVSGKEIENGLFEYNDMVATDYCQYHNNDTLAMGFEGKLYEIMNGYCYGWTSLYDSFEKIFDKRGLFFEQGYAYTLSVYED